jgi:hypothetical protein
MDIDQLYAGMAKAEIFGRGNYMGDGLYVVETKNIFVKEGFKGRSFICEFTVIESNNAEHAPGTSGSWVLKFENKFTFGNITRLVMALLGYANTKENQQNEAIRLEVERVARAVSGSDKAKAELGADYTEGMLVGLRVKLECSKVKTAPNAKNPVGGEYTAHDWSPLPVAA